MHGKTFMLPVVTRAACLILVACGAVSARAEFLVRDQQYRCPPSQQQCRNLKPAFEERTTKAGNSYSINFVEYDDKGRPWDPLELDDAVEQVRTARGPNSDQGVLLMVYVHGWQNNADEQQGTCNDVCRFRDHLLPELADRFSTSGATPLRVVGVYLAWRGLTFTAEPFKHIVSYWPRRGVARHVGQTGMFHALERIEQTVAQKRDNYVVVLAGHSFGARVLENAAEIRDSKHTGFMLNYREQVKRMAAEREKAMLARPDFTARMNRNLPADLVVYVNAATSSNVTRKTIRNFRDTCSAVPEAPICGADPFYLAFTSHADRATGIIMPIANLVIPSWSADGIHIFSAANSPWMHTHADPVDGCKGPPALCFDVKPGPPPVQQSIERIDKRSQIPGRTTSPFWIFNVDESVSGGHGDVWNDAVISLVANAISKTNRAVALRSVALRP